MDERELDNAMRVLAEILANALRFMPFIAWPALEDVA